MIDDVRAVLDGTRRWAVVRGDAVVWMLRLAWEQGDRDDHDDPVAAVESLKPEGPRQRSLFGGGPR